MEMNEGIKKLENLRKKASEGGGAERTRKLRQEGYLTAEERITLLLDPGTFLEVNTLAGPQPAEFGSPPPYIPRDGVITGFGQVSGRTIGVYAHDKTVQGGSLGNVQAAKIVQHHPPGLRNESSRDGFARFGRRADSGREQKCWV